MTAPGGLEARFAGHAEIEPGVGGVVRVLGPTLAIPYDLVVVEAWTVGRPGPGLDRADAMTTGRDLVAILAQGP